MSAFRLQTFAPPSAGAATPGPDPRALAIEAAREAAWRDGYVAGQAAATEAFLDDQTRLTSDLVESIADARMTNEAARRHVAASLAPLAAAICAALTPALAEAGLGEEVAARVAAALAAAPEARPRLRCAPELAATLRGVLAERGLAGTIEPAPELLPREAVLIWDEGFDRIDLDACAAEIRSCVELHLHGEEAPEERRRYG